MAGTLKGLIGRPREFFRQRGQQKTTCMKYKHIIQELRQFILHDKFELNLRLIK